MPKYSIIIPCYNGMPYIKSCIETIVSQNYSDYEIILSEDHSTDGTSEYVDSLNNPHIKSLHCPERMSMAEHWEWALTYATGEWQMFVGQDDGLQSYFFELADELTAIAEKKKLQAIMSERAYYFWSGLQEIYDKMMLVYSAKCEFKTLKTKTEIKNALYKKPLSYMDFPCMYTTSLFHKDFIAYIKQKQNGVVFTTHPQDANLAALSAVFLKKYLKSYIPLGWVGSSSKSAGMAISQDKSNSELKETYLSSIKKSRLPCHPLAGDFNIASFYLYFWGALLFVAEKQDKKLAKYLLSTKLKVRVFKAVYNDILSTTKKQDYRLELFNELLKVNKISIEQIIKVKNKEAQRNIFSKIISKLVNIYTRIINKIIRTLYKPKSFSYSEDYHDNVKSFTELSRQIAESVKFML